ncbi:MAG: pimeloyl-ACP methyl ester esterase BioH [Gammaproteobacteria bacterium]|nr:pimeloyl-ACP methyl ester esterase BioH [Gammaproteobacteria bacterium]
MKSKLSYKVIGTGKSVVLIHGWGAHSGVWQMIVPQLSKEFRVTLIDLPGYGDNKILSQKHTLLNIGKKISSIIPEGSIVIGWSMGGLIAIWLAIHYQCLVGKLILTNATPCFIEKNDWPGVRVDVFQAFKKGLRKDLERTSLRFMALQVNLDNHQEARKQLQILKNIMIVEDGVSEKVLTQGLSILLDTDLRLDLVKIKAPILWLLGAKDKLVPAEIDKYLKFYMPQAQIKVMLKAAHIPFISHVDCFLKTIKKFIYE